MKTISQEEKDAIRRAREAEKRSRVMAEIASADRFNRRVERGVLWALAAIGLVLAGLLVWQVSSRRAEARARYRDATYAAFTNLVAEADAIRVEREEAFAAIDLSMVRNYALVEQAKDMARFHDEIDKGRIAVNYAKERMRRLFGGILTMFPSESANERLDAQRLYGERMGELDAVESRLDADAYALDFLDDNRGKWRVHRGKVMFEDKKLAREFEVFAQDVDTATARWHRDFGGSTIESNVIQIKPMPKK